MQTLTLAQAAAALGLHPDTLRERAAAAYKVVDDKWDLVIHDDELWESLKSAITELHDALRDAGLLA